MYGGAARGRVAANKVIFAGTWRGSGKKASARNLRVKRVCIQMYVVGRRRVEGWRGNFA